MWCSTNVCNWKNNTQWYIQSYTMMLKDFGAVLLFYSSVVKIQITSQVWIWANKIGLLSAVIDLSSTTANKHTSVQTTANRQWENWGSNKSAKLKGRRMNRKQRAHVKVWPKYTMNMNTNTMFIVFWLAMIKLPPSRWIWMIKALLSNTRHPHQWPYFTGIIGESNVIYRQDCEPLVSAAAVLNVSVSQV